MMGIAENQGLNNRVSRGFPAENKPLDKPNSAVAKVKIEDESQRAVLEAAGASFHNGH